MLSTATRSGKKRWITGGMTTLPMPMPASAHADVSNSTGTLVEKLRVSRPSAASTIAVSATCSRPNRRTSRGVTMPARLNIKVGTMPSTLATPVPKRMSSDTRSSNGVIEVTAVRSEKAESTTATSNARRVESGVRRCAVIGASVVVAIRKS